MRYKGYVGRTEVDDETGLISGVVIGLRDVVTYQGWTIEEARRSFRESIDLYLRTCEEEGIAPDRPFSGKLMIRTTPRVHRALAARAELRGESLNQMLDRYLTRIARKLDDPAPIDLRRSGPTGRGTRGQAAAKITGPARSAASGGATSGATRRGDRAKGGTKGRA